MMKHNRGCQHIEPQAENIISGYPFRVPGTQGKIGNENEEFIKETLESYRSFCTSQGISNFKLSAGDLVALATGNINKVAEALTRLISSLPIMPLNTEELREIYKHARQALIRA